MYAPPREAVLGSAGSKRKRGGVLPEAPRAARVSIDSLMDCLRNDPTLQNALDGSCWGRLGELHAKYTNGDVTQRGFVDSVGAIVGTMKLLSIVKQLSAQQQRGPHPAPLQRISSNGSSSSGTPGTPGGAEVHRILSVNQTTRRRVATPRTPELSAELQALVHAWHCDDPACSDPKCDQLKVQLERIEAHIAVCEQPMDTCKACKVWLALQRTARPVRSPAPK